MRIKWAFPCLVLLLFFLPLAYIRYTPTALLVGDRAMTYPLTSVMNTAWIEDARQLSPTNVYAADLIAVADPASIPRIQSVIPLLSSYVKYGGILVIIGPVGKDTFDDNTVGLHQFGPVVRVDAKTYPVVDMTYLQGVGDFKADGPIPSMPLLDSHVFLQAYEGDTYGWRPIMAWKQYGKGRIITLSLLQLSYTGAYADSPAWRQVQQLFLNFIGRPNYPTESILFALAGIATIIGVAIIGRRQN